MSTQDKKILSTHARLGRHLFSAYATHSAAADRDHLGLLVPLETMENMVQLVSPDLLVAPESQPQLGLPATCHADSALEVALDPLEALDLLEKLVALDPLDNPALLEGLVQMAALDPRDQQEPLAALDPLDPQDPLDKVALREAKAPWEPLDLLDLVAQLDPLECLDAPEPEAPMVPPDLLDPSDPVDLQEELACPDHQAPSQPLERMPTTALAHADTNKKISAACLAFDTLTVMKSCAILELFSNMKLAGFYVYFS